MPVARIAAVSILLLIPFATSAADPDLAIRARAVLRKHCLECHGDMNRRGDLSITDRIGMERAERPFIAATADASQLMQLIEDGSMPPGNRTKLTKAESDLVGEWINAAAPLYPKRFDDLYVVNTVLADVKKQNEADVPFMRYFSLADLVADDDSTFSLAAGRAALHQALSQLSKDVLPPLVPADASETVFRVDLRKAGWDMKPFERRFLVNKVPTFERSDVNLYDLILIEYPFGRLYPADASFDQLAGAYFEKTKQVRPLAFIRGEWFARQFLASPVARELREALDGKRLEAKAARPKPIEMPDSLRPPDAPPGSIAVLPLDSVSRRDFAQPFNVEFDLVSEAKDRPTQRFTLGEKFYFYVQPAREVSIEIIWKDIAGKRVRINLREQDSRVLAEKDKYFGTRDRQDNEIPYTMTGNTPGKEYITIFASEQPFPQGEVLKTKHFLDERVIHPFYPLSRMKTDFDPAKIVKKTIEIDIQKKE